MSTNYRQVKIPKQDWSIPSDVTQSVKISNEIWGELKRQFDEFAVNKKVNPHQIQEGLRSIGFHKEQKSIKSLKTFVLSMISMEMILHRINLFNSLTNISEIQIQDRESLSYSMPLQIKRKEQSLQRPCIKSFKN